MLVELGKKRLGLVALNTVQVCQSLANNTDCKRLLSRSRFGLVQDLDEEHTRLSEVGTEAFGRQAESQRGYDVAGVLLEHVVVLSEVVVKVFVALLFFILHLAVDLVLEDFQDDLA